MSKLVYLDNAATTPVCNEAIKAMNDAMSEAFYNPSARYAQSNDILNRINDDRAYICGLLHASYGRELYFTSGGTESNNTVLYGCKKKKNCRIIVGEGEHDSIIAPANELKNSGYDVRFAPIDEHGRTDIEALKELINEETAIVSVMHASNETGAINDIATIARVTRKLAPAAIVHSDGVQAFMKIPVNLSALDVDAYSITAHKVNGPKGIGSLIIKNGACVKPLILGGGQEKGMRSGTESFPLIHSFRAAVECKFKNFSENYSKIFTYREQFLAQLRQSMDEFVVITPMENSVPNMLTLAFKNVRGEVMLHALEEFGILVGVGSACASHHESRFKKLLKLDKAYQDGIVRISVGTENDLNEINYVTQSIKECYAKLSKTVRQ